MRYDTLISNGLLLTMEKNLPVVQDGAVLIKDGAIEAYGSSEQFADADVEHRISAKNKIIMPGLVNCHTHMPMSMFRGLADDLPLDVWLNEHIFPAEARQVNSESVEKWSRHSCTEMLLAGTTTCCDGYFFEENVAKAVADTGIRAIVGQGVIDFPAPGVPDPEKNVEAAISFVEAVKENSPIVYPSIFCHSPYLCSKDTLVRAKKAANQLGVLFQIHVAETAREKDMISELNGQSIIQYLDNIGILDKKTLLVHCVWIDEEDIRIINSTGAGVVHCPESNMKLASGISPVPEMIDIGMAVGLGTDGSASNNDLDLFSEMDTAAKLHKVAKMDPCVMDARTTVQMATIHGAKALGLDKVIGSIEKGKRADIILVDTDKPHLTPLFDPYSALVYAAKSSDVSLVMVDGVIRSRGGQIV